MEENNRKLPNTATEDLARIGEFKINKNAFKFPAESEPGKIFLADYNLNPCIPMNSAQAVCESATPENYAPNNKVIISSRDRLTIEVYNDTIFLTEIDHNGKGSHIQLNFGQLDIIHRNAKRLRIEQATEALRNISTETARHIERLNTLTNPE